MVGGSLPGPTFSHWVWLIRANDPPVPLRSSAPGIPFFDDMTPPHETVSYAACLAPRYRVTRARDPKAVVKMRV